MKARWQIKTLGEVCTFDKVQGLHCGLPYVGLEHIESHTARFIGSYEPQSVKSATFRFSDEHVLYGRLRPYLNKAFAPDFEGHCSTEIFPILPNPDLSREYLLYWLMADGTCNRINATCTGARMPRAQMRDLLGFEIHVPPIPEQKRIVGLLDEAIEGIASTKANAETNLQNARALFESHLQSVFSQRGPGWVGKKLEDVANADCSLSYGIVQPGEECSDGMPVVRPTDLSSKFIYLKGLKRIDPKLAYGYRRTALHGGELLLCVRGSTGVVSVASNELAGANVTRGIVPIRFNSSILTPEFGYYQMRSAPVQDQIREKTYGSALMQINIRDLRLISLSIPSIEEQKNITATLDILHDSTQRLTQIYQQKIAALDELKKALLHKAFSGEL